MPKECTQCHIVKSLAAFSADRSARDGRAYRCRDCAKEYDRRRAMLPHRVEARRQYQQSEHGREVRKPILQRYAQTDSGKRTGKRAWQRWTQKNPEKYKAHILLNAAVKRGRVQKEPCEICGDAQAHGHHQDYTKPLEVRWLCPKHHKAVHMGDLSL